MLRKLLTQFERHWFRWPRVAAAHSFGLPNALSAPIRGCRSVDQGRTEEKEWRGMGWNAREREREVKHGPRDSGRRWQPGRRSVRTWIELRERHIFLPFTFIFRSNRDIRPESRPSGVYLRRSLSVAAKVPYILSQFDRRHRVSDVRFNSFGSIFHAPVSLFSHPDALLTRAGSCWIKRRIKAVAVAEGEG